LKTAIAYTRSVLGKGVNINELRTVVVDANSFRPISSFTPGELTPEAFERDRASERLALMMQNIGRVLRGEPGKTACIILLNADEDLITAIKESTAIQEACEDPVVFAEVGEDLVQTVDRCYRWLKAGGGEWPEPDPAKVKPRALAGRPKGSKKTPEQIFDEAREAARKGMTEREFGKKKHPERYLSSEQMSKVHMIFTRAPDLR
jgi:hypothetical protein